MFKSLFHRVVRLSAVHVRNFPSIKSSHNVSKLCKSAQVSGLSLSRTFTTVPGHGSPTPKTGSLATSSAPAGGSDAYAAHTQDDIDIGLYDDPEMWADFRHLPAICSVEVRRNADGDLEGDYKGVTCIFPDQEANLEWVLSTPVDVHLFEEQPFVKDCPDDDDTSHHAQDTGFDDPDDLDANQHQQRKKAAEVH